MQKNLALALITLTIIIAIGAAFFLRYEIVNKANGQVAHLDRWTGEVQMCDHTACIRPPLVNYAQDGTAMHFPQGTDNDVILKAEKALNAKAERDLFKEVEQQKPWERNLPNDATADQFATDKELKEVN